MKPGDLVAKTTTQLYVDPPELMGYVDSFNVVSKDRRTFISHNGVVTYDQVGVVIDVKNYCVKVLFDCKIGWCWGWELVPVEQ